MIEKEQVSLPYRNLVTEDLIVPGFEGYFRYDPEGNLWVREIFLPDLVNLYGTPLEIVDLDMIALRCRQWPEMVREYAEKVGYKGGFAYHYATKANPSYPFVSTACHHGWGLEFSSWQDCDNFYWMLRQKKVKKEEVRILCNGSKLPPQAYGIPSRVRTLKSDAVFETSYRDLQNTHESSYADYICLLRRMGVNIIPILDEGELNFFAQRNEVPPMEVGLRMQFGKTSRETDLSAVSTRFGMSWQEIGRTARSIEKIPHLTLTVLHAMVAAGEVVPPDDFSASLVFAAEKYFELKKQHPSLKSLDIGGGIPPMSSHYDYERLMIQFLGKVKSLAESFNLPEPQIIFELGSFVSADAGMTVFTVVQEKTQDHTKWYLVDSSLMMTVPDALMTKREFTVLAGNNANFPAQEVVIGGITCDSDDVYPVKDQSQKGKRVLLPVRKAEESPQIVVFNETGAYQDTLSGEGGAHHCLLMQEAKVYLWTAKDGRTHVRCFPRQTSYNIRKLMGYI